jgi:hypothetical protein
VIADVPVAPAANVRAAGLAVTAKSGTATLTLIVALRERVPLVPVAVTVKVPLAEELQDSVEVPDPVTLVGVREHMSPVAGEMLLVRLTTPPNPLRAAMVMVELLVPPTFIVLLVGFAAIVKSWIVKVTIDVWVSDPLVPVRVTV